jgi:hypothetical protein
MVYESMAPSYSWSLNKDLQLGFYENEGVCLILIPAADFVMGGWDLMSRQGVRVKKNNRCRRGWLARWCHGSLVNLPTLATVDGSGCEIDQNEPETEGILAWGQMRRRTASQRLVAATSSSPSSAIVKASVRCSSDNENWPMGYSCPPLAIQFLHRGGGRSHTKIFLGL